MERQFAQFDAIISDLRAAGAQMQETEIITHLLMTLPKSYESVRTALETLEPEGLTVAKVKAQLFSEEIKRFELGESGVESAEGAISGAAFLGRRKRFAGKCWQCKQVGHKANECPRNEDYREREQGSERRSDKKVFQLNKDENSFYREDLNRGGFAFVVKGKDSSSDDSGCCWLLDSGCTDHMVNSDGLFTFEKTFPLPYPVSLAEEGQIVRATKIGFIAAASNIHGREYPCDISEVLYVPGLRHNSLSVSRLEKAGCVVIFRDGIVELWSENVLFAIGKRKQDLYEIRFTLRKHQVNLVEKAIRVNVLWHRRLGHICMQNLHNMSKKRIVTGIDSSVTGALGICEPCIMGKQCRTSFTRKEKKTTRPLELVHTNVCGPISPKTWDNKRYFGKSKQWVMVGYGNTGYRLWDFRERAIVLSRDVTFDEGRFLRLARCEDENSYNFVGNNDEMESDEELAQRDEQELNIEEGNNDSLNSDGEQFLTDEGEPDEQEVPEAETNINQPRQSTRIR